MARARQDSLQKVSIAYAGELSRINWEIDSAAAQARLENSIAQSEQRLANGIGERRLETELHWLNQQQEFLAIRQQGRGTPYEEARISTLKAQMRDIEQELLILEHEISDRERRLDILKHDSAVDIYNQHKHDDVLMRVVRGRTKAAYRIPTSRWPFIVKFGRPT